MVRVHLIIDRGLITVKSEGEMLGDAVFSYCEGEHLVFMFPESTHVEIHVPEPETDLKSFVSEFIHTKTVNATG